MKKNKLVVRGMLAGVLAVSCAAVLTITACDHQEDHRETEQIRGAITYSVEVTNSQASSRMAASVIPGATRAAIDPADTVELYIERFEYLHDTNGIALFLINNGNADMGSKGGILNNAGWYSVNADLKVENDVNNGTYSAFQIRITKLRVNETEYDFPSLDNAVRDAVAFGSPTALWGEFPEIYPDNFSGITMTDDVLSLKTVLTVEPDILNDGVLADDPYQYIKVEGRINEPSGGGGNESTAKSIKITGITLDVGSETDGQAGVFIYTKPQFGHGPDAGLIAREVYHTGEIIDGELLVDLYVCKDGDMATDDRWTGSGKYYIYLGVAGPAGWPDDGDGRTVLRYWWATDGAVAKYNIQDALTTIEFSQFKEAGN